MKSQTEGKKEKLIITCEVEDFPEDGQFLDFRITVVRDGWFTRIFKDWKKIEFKRALVTKITKE